MFWLRKIFRPRKIDLPSASDIFKQELNPLSNAFYYDQYRIWRVKREYLNIPFKQDPDAWYSTIPDTNSQDPVFDAEHNNIYIKGHTPSDHKMMVLWIAKEWLDKQMANILVYRLENYPYTYSVHRLYTIEHKNGERLWWLKGDNPYLFKDPIPAKDNEILYLYCGTIC